MESIMMIVDDIEMNRALLKKIFQEEFTFLEASSGEEAVALLRGHDQKIDFMLLDISMPGISGIEFLHRYRSEPFLKDVPVVVITSSDKTADQLEAFDAGANEFITKPFNPKVVRTRVQNVWASSERLHEIEQEKQLLAAKAARDAMTELLNKPAAEELIRSRLKEKPKGVHALMMIDIDNFKRVNDSQGHLTGDHVIKLVTQEITSIFRKEDVISRFGGDEFCVFLSDLPGKGIARSKAQALSGAIMLRSDQQASVPFSVSVGIAFAKEGCTCEELIGWADEALYTSKKNGKARVSEYEFGEDHAAVVSEVTEADAHMRNLLNRIPTGVGVLYVFPNREMRFGYFNDSFYAMLGESREERLQYIGNTLFESVHPEDVQRAMEEGRAVIREGRSGCVDVRLRHRDGSYRWYRAQAAVTDRAEKYATLFLSFLDMQEAHKQKTELQRQREMLAAAVENGHIGLWRFDLDSQKIVQDFSRPMDGVDHVGRNALQEMIAAGLLHEGSVDALRRCYAAIYAGQGRSECTVRFFSRQNGCYEEKRIVLVRQPDSEEYGRTAVGVSMKAAQNGQELPST